MYLRTPRGKRKLEVFINGKKLRKIVLRNAAANNDVSKVKFLVSRGADVNKKYSFDRTPLHFAAWKNVNASHMKVAEILLENGAQINAKDLEGRTPMFLLVQRGNAQIIQLFLDFKADINVLDCADRTLLFPAVANIENFNVMQFLIDLGLNVNHRSDFKNTPLHEAAYRNHYDSHFEVAETLLNSGADINAQDVHGLTPLHILVENGNLRIVQLFLDFQANVNTVDNDNENLLFPAVYNIQNAEVLQLLIDLGLDVNHKNIEGKTPSQYAMNCTMENFKIMKCLFRNNAFSFDNNDMLPLWNTVRREGVKFGGFVRRINLNFLLEYSEHNGLTIDDNAYLLSLYGKVYEFYLQQLIVENAAKLKAVDPSVQTESFLLHVDADHANYYKQCEEELLLAKDTKILQTGISCLDLLVGSTRKMKNYAGNTDLIEHVNQNSERYLTEFPIYGPKIEKKLRKEIMKRELYDESCIILSDCLPIFNPVHLIIRDILNHILSLKDLMKFREQ